MKINVNGAQHEADVANDIPLLWVLREQLGLTGAKYGCGAAQCGACTVHADGVAIRSCVRPASAVGEEKITTIEGAKGSIAEAVMNAWERIDVAQCGYCQPGQVMSAISLLTINPRPTDSDIDQAMSGNICRCGTYVRIRAAIHEAAQTLSKPAAKAKA